MNPEISLNILKARMANGMSLVEALEIYAIKQNIDSPIIQDYIKSLTPEPQEKEIDTPIILKGLKHINSKSRSVTLRLPIDLYDQLIQEGNISQSIVRRLRESFK